MYSIGAVSGATRGGRAGATGTPLLARPRGSPTSTTRAASSRRRRRSPAASRCCCGSRADGGDVVFAVLVLRSDPADVVTPVRLRRAGRRRDRSRRSPGSPPPTRTGARARGVLSSFVVFHPLLGNAARRGGAGFRRTALAGTVAWPLDAATCSPAMHQHHRRLVRRARARGLRGRRRAGARRTSTGSSTSTRQTMRRAGAAPFYFFAADYWDGAARAACRSCGSTCATTASSLASVLGHGRAAVAALPPRRHHGRGPRGPARATSRSTRSPRWGQEHGYATLHLGGGVGGRADSLLELQAAASRPAGCVGAAIGKAVHDDGRPTCALPGADAVDWDGFFPAYRAAVLTAALAGSRSRRASAKRSSRPRSWTSRRRRKLTLRISSLW